MLTYWLKGYRVDGFRFYSVKGLGNDNSCPNAGDSCIDAFNQSRIDRMRQPHLRIDRQLSEES